MKRMFPCQPITRRQSRDLSHHQTGQEEREEEDLTHHQTGQEEVEEEMCDSCPPGLGPASGLCDRAV